MNNETFVFTQEYYNGLIKSLFCLLIQLILFISIPVLPFLSQDINQITFISWLLCLLTILGTFGQAITVEEIILCHKRLEKFE